MRSEQLNIEAGEIRKQHQMCCVFARRRPENNIEAFHWRIQLTVARAELKKKGKEMRGLN